MRWDARAFFILGRVLRVLGSSPFCLATVVILLIVACLIGFGCRGCVRW